MWLDRGRLAHRFEALRRRNVNRRKIRRRTRGGRCAELRRLQRALLCVSSRHRRACAALAAVPAALAPWALVIAFPLFGPALRDVALGLPLLLRRFALLALAASRVAGRPIGACVALAAFVARPPLTPLVTVLLAAPVATALIRATFGAPAESIAFSPVATLGPL